MKKDGIVITQSIEDLYGVPKNRANKYSKNIEREVVTQGDQIIAFLYINVDGVKVVIGTKCDEIDKKDPKKSYAESHKWCDEQIQIIENNSEIFNGH